MSDAPERIWAQATACGNWEEPIATPVRVPHFHEYVRADAITALEAENQRLRDEVGALKQAITKRQSAMFSTCNIDLRGAGYHCAFKNGGEKIGVLNEGDKVMFDAEAQLFLFDNLHILGPVALEEIKNQAARAALEG